MPLFKMFHSAFIRKLVMKLHSHIALQGDPLVREGQPVPGVFFGMTLRGGGLHNYYDYYYRCCCAWCCIASGVLPCLGSPPLDEIRLLAGWAGTSRLRNLLTPRAAHALARLISLPMCWSCANSSQGPGARDPVVPRCPEEPREVVHLGAHGHRVAHVSPRRHQAGGHDRGGWRVW